MANDEVRGILHKAIDDLCDRAESIEVSNHAFLRQVPPGPESQNIEHELTGAHALTVLWQEPHGS